MVFQKVMKIVTIIQRMFRRSAPVLAPVGVGPTGSLMYVNASPQLAEKIAAVYSCVKLISESIAKIPLEYKRYNKYGKYFVRDYSSPLYDILNVRPNEKMSAYDFMRGLWVKVLMEGNGYVLIRRDIYGKVDDLVLLNSVTYDAPTNTYSVNDYVNGIVGTYMSGDIIHIRNLGFGDGLTGESTIRMAARVIGVSASADRELTEVFDAGGRQRGIITGGDSGQMGFAAQKDTQVAKQAASMAERLRSGERIIPMPGDMKFTPFQMTPADIQLLDNKRFTVKEIGRFFRVSPSLLYEDGGNTYTNAEMSPVVFLNTTLSPLLTQLEQEFMHKLISKENRAYYRITFDRDVMYNTDLTTKTNRQRGMLETGIKTVNELRRDEGMPAIEGGDVPMISANLVPLKERVNPQNVEPKQPNKNA